MFRVFMLLAYLFLGPAQLYAKSDLASQKTFNDSGALTLVLDTIYDASFDFEGLYIIGHNMEFLSEKKDCEVVPTAGLVSHFKKIFKEFTSYYPDEELPYDEALSDLKEIAQGADFKRCYERQEGGRGYVEVTHYQSLSTPLWIRIEYNVQY
jgi:hypothetical protein